MTPDELREKHQVYRDNEAKWKFYKLSYEGGDDYITSVLFKYNRESVDNHDDRKKEGFVLNFNAAIIDLFNFYLIEKGVARHMAKVDEDAQWKMFLDDCDLNNNNYDFFLNECSKLSSRYGVIGILVNKAAGGVNLAQEIKDKIYPYLSVYSPLNILDWKFKKNPKTNRRELVYLKLLDEGEYLIWYPDRWELWKIDINLGKEVSVKVASGENSLEEIPFVWMVNNAGLENNQKGVSDIKDICKIVSSITRDFSCANEIIKYAGFPMMRKPMALEGAEIGLDVVGPTNVIEFSPEHGEHGKPDWLETAVLDPIDAILRLTDRKVDEIYRVAHLSGVHGQRKSNNEVSSGLAVRYEYQQLNSVLGNKSFTLTETELKIIWFWLKWQNKEDLFDQIQIIRSKNFSIDDLSVDLDNCFNSMQQIVSDTYKKLIQKRVAYNTLPDLTDEERELIAKEIEENLKKAQEEADRVKGQIMNGQQDQEEDQDPNADPKQNQSAFKNPNDPTKKSPVKSAAASRKAAVAE